MAHIGLPLVGDALYGGKPEFGLAHQALHAHSLSFHHPVGGRPLSFGAALPPDIAQALEKAGISSV
jgi:23S rRNA pseudouridine1911/1915/1917 synthase